MRIAVMHIERAFHEQLPPVSFGLSSVVLAAISLAMFFLPVIAIPVAGCAILAALLGLFGALVGWSQSVRLCVAGLLLGGFDLGTITAMNAATDGYFTPRSVFPVLQPTSRRPFVAPPAPPAGARWEGMINQPRRHWRLGSTSLADVRPESLVGATARSSTTC
jgi:hypothetical protein